MARNSVKASQKGIRDAEKALKKKRWIRSTLQTEVPCSNQPIYKFFKGLKTERRIFIRICESLGLNWEEIADFSEDAKPLLEDKNHGSIFDIDSLVQKVRSQFYNKIKARCENLCLFDDISELPWRSVKLKQICIENVKFREEFDRFTSNKAPQAPVHWEDLALTKSRLMVLGKPGAGKSALLQHIAMQCNEHKFKPELVPIFIILKHYAEDARDAGGVSFLDYISQEYGGDEVSKQEIENLLDNGRVLILLDGLDEVPKQDVDEILKQLRRLLNKYSNNPIILTCRKSAQESKSNQFSDFTFVEVADFDQKQIEKFVRNWFEVVPVPGNSLPEGASRVNWLVQLLQLPKNQRIRELAGTPLLLHLICLVFQETGDLPWRRSELYEQALDLLLLDWNQFNKRIQWNETARNLLKSKIKLLKQIAAITFEKGESSFKLDRFKDILEESSIACENVLQSLEAQHGLLIKRGWRTYSFSHLTFQEYLTAIDFFEKSQSEPQVLEDLVSHLTDTRWHEVFLLVAEMLPNIDELLRLMKQRIDAIVTSEASDAKLNQVLDWIKQKSISWNVPYKAAAVRAVYFTNFTLNFDIFYLSALIDPAILEDLCHNRARVLPIELDLYLDQTLYSVLRHDIWHSRFARACICARLLNPEIERWLKQLAQIPDLDEKQKRIMEWWQDSESIWTGQFAPELEPSLEKLKALLPDSTEDEQGLKAWCHDNGQAWTEELRALMIKHRNIGHDWQFNIQECEVLIQYYNANKLLIDCQNNNFERVTSEVWEEIEKTLFLPKSEIEKSCITL